MSSFKRDKIGRIRPCTRRTQKTTVSRLRGEPKRESRIRLSITPCFATKAGSKIVYKRIRKVDPESTPTAIRRQTDSDE